MTRKNEKCTNADKRFRELQKKIAENIRKVSPETAKDMTKHEDEIEKYLA